MNRKEVIEYLSPTKTGPIKIEQKLRYTISGFLKNKISYSFTYECEELGISWRSDGAILNNGFNKLSVFDLFQDCKLDVDYLRSQQRAYETVPAKRKELKSYLQTYKSRTIEVLFIDENWRRDYWFCKQSKYLNFNVYVKEETRFLIQISPAKFMLDIVMDNSPTSRTYELSSIPGKKGKYGYATASFFASAKLKEISNYFSQFGFALHEETIKQIESFMKEGEGCTGKIYREDESTEGEDSYFNEDDSDNYDDDDTVNSKVEYLSIFGLGEDAIWDDVVYARNVMLKMWHPDRWMNDSRRKNMAEKQIKKINNAFDALKKYFEGTDSTKR